MHMRISLAVVAGAAAAVPLSGASAFSIGARIHGSRLAPAGPAATGLASAAGRESAGGGGGPAGATAISPDVVESARERVLSLASQLKEESKTGVFLSDASSRSDLCRAVADLEAVCGNMSERSLDLMLGDWTLLCTTSPSRGGGSKNEKQVRKLSLFGSKGGLPELPFQDKLRKSFDVTQRIRAGKEGGAIDRVDNVIQFTPFANKLGDLLGDSSPLSALGDIVINPLELTKSKVALVHDAKVESVSPVLRTKINLKSYVLTVAGTSQYLEPNGADILGLNVPLSEFQSGRFDTTFVDEALRISRGRQGAVETLRVFVRADGVDEANGAAGGVADAVDAEEAREVVEDEARGNTENFQEAASASDEGTDRVDVDAKAKMERDEEMFRRRLLEARLKRESKEDGGETESG